MSNSSLFTLAFLRTLSFVSIAVHETRRILLSPFISKASRHVSSFFLRVQLSQPYVATGHTSAFISRILVGIGMLWLFHRHIFWCACGLHELTRWMEVGLLCRTGRRVHLWEASRMVRPLSALTHPSPKSRPLQCEHWNQFWKFTLPSGQRAGLRRRRAWVQIAAATMSGNCLRQTVHTHRASVRQAAKLVAALLRVAGVTAGLAESNGNLPPGLWLTSRAGWLSTTGISSGTLRSVIEYGLTLPFYIVKYVNWPTNDNNTGVRFTRYLTTMLRSSYDNDKFTIDLWRTSNLQNILRRTQGFS